MPGSWTGLSTSGERRAGRSWAITGRRPPWHRGGSGGSRRSRSGGAWTRPGRSCRLGCPGPARASRRGQRPPSVPPRGWGDLRATADGRLRVGLPLQPGIAHLNADRSRFRVSIPYFAGRPLQRCCQPLTSGGSPWCFNPLLRGATFATGRHSPGLSLAGGFNPLLRGATFATW